jgi:hypothetical protein
VVTGCAVTGPVVAGAVVAGPVVAGSVVAGGVVAGCVVADGVVAGWVVADWVAGPVVAGGGLVEGGGDCAGDGGGIAVGVADWGTAPPFCEGWDEGEPSVLPVWAGGLVCAAGEPPMTLGTRRAAATTAASSPLASSAHARPRRFLRGGWRCAPGG